jgi:hypothetical protein
MSKQKPNEKQEQGTRQGAEETEPIRHKGGGRSTPEEEHSGPKPEGNGGTGQPAAFPPHN